MDDRIVIAWLGVKDLQKPDSHSWLEFLKAALPNLWAPGIGFSMDRGWGGGWTVGCLGGYWSTPGLWVGATPGLKDSITMTQIPCSLWKAVGECEAVLLEEMGPQCSLNSP